MTARDCKNRTYDSHTSTFLLFTFFLKVFHRNPSGNFSMPPLGNILNLLLKGFFPFHCSVFCTLKSHTAWNRKRKSDALANFPWRVFHRILDNMDIISVRLWKFQMKQPSNSPETALKQPSCPYKGAVWGLFIGSLDAVSFGGDRSELLPQQKKTASFSKNR